jgi:hypothetical protein
MLSLLIVPRLPAQNGDMHNILIGRWKSVVRTQIGTTDIYIMELRADTMFKTTIYVNGNFSSPAWQSGTWGVRNGNELWIHNMAWFPMYTGDANGRRIPVRLQPDLAWKLEIVDRDHVRGALGQIATRIG